MATKQRLTNAETLELYRVSLENVEKQPEIALAMGDLGYDTVKISIGKDILSNTRQAYDHNITEDDESSAAYGAFDEKREQLEDLYFLHRKKAKVVYRNDAITAEKLAIAGAFPRTYIKWFENVKRFYTIVIDDTDIQTKLVILKITTEEIATGLSLISEVESTRAEYLREKGESQDATKSKDAAFATLDDWMSEFFAVAKIALEDKPQLLESLGKLVRN